MADLGLCFSFMKSGAFCHVFLFDSVVCCLFFLLFFFVVFLLFFFFVVFFSVHAQIRKILRMYRTTFGQET